MLHHTDNAVVAHLVTDWSLVRDGVTARMQHRCAQVSTHLQRLLPDGDVCTRHRFGGISKVYASLGGKTAAIELHSSRGDVLYRAVDGLGEPLSDYQDPVDRLSFGGPCEEVVAWLKRSS